jgi:two-component system nitrate/nitrite response regulator NarL
VSQPALSPIRTFVAESSPISSQLLAEALARDSGIDVLGFSSNPQEIARIIGVSLVDVLLVSAQMEEDPNRGLVLLRELRRERPGLKAVVLVDSSKPGVVVEAFRSGASGVFCRNTAIRLLRKCITAVHSGQVWANSEELGFVLAALETNVPVQLDSKRLAALSARESEVVRCLIEGFTNREIAQTLAISQHTVKNYMFKIFDKLGVSNRVELVFQVLSRPSGIGTIHRSVQDRTPFTAALRRTFESVGKQDAQLPNVMEGKPAVFLPSRFGKGPSSITAKAVGSD